MDSINKVNKLNKSDFISIEVKKLLLNLFDLKIIIFVLLIFFIKFLYLCSLFKLKFFNKSSSIFLTLKLILGFKKGFNSI